MYIPASLFAEDNGVDEDRFNAVIDLAEKAYQEVFKSKGRRLVVVERKWSSGTVNAYAYQRGKTSYVAMFGGLARHPAVTADGFLTVVCHEIGHHIGGYPFVNSWASNEGQSDYYATTKCLKAAWKGRDHKKTLQRMYDNMGLSRSSGGFQHG